MCSHKRSGNLSILAPNCVGAMGRQKKPVLRRSGRTIPSRHALRTAQRVSVCVCSDAWFFSVSDHGWFSCWAQRQAQVARKQLAERKRLQRLARKGLSDEQFKDEVKFTYVLMLH